MKNEAAIPTVTEQARGFFVQGDALAKQGKLGKAAQAFQQAINLSPNFPEALSALGLVQLIAGQRTSNADVLMLATQSLERSLRLRAGHAETLVNLCKAYLLLNKPNRAVEVTQKLTTQAPEMAEGWSLQGQAHAKMSDYAGAVKCYQKALEITPNAADFLALALIQERMNHLDEAIRTIENGRKIAPSDAQFLLPLARIERRRGEPKKARGHLEEILQQGTAQPLIRNAACNELAKALDADGEYDAAFRYYTDAQIALSQSHDAKQVANSDMFDTLIPLQQRWFSRERIEQRKAANTQAPAMQDSPIFLVGFPRSGTTLTEQILSSHPRIMGTQEEEIFFRMIMNLPRIIGSKQPYPALLEILTDAEAEKLRSFYLTQAAAATGQQPGQGRILDKLPLNILHLGLIYWLFPNARILMLLRDPRDVVLSCFMQIFNPNAAMNKFFTLESAAQFYAQVMGLYQHFKSVLPLNILEVRYEDIVADMESNTRKILEFVGEGWDNSVLEYYKVDKNRHVTTPSYEGVMRPIYNSSVQRWKHYEKHLAPVQPILKPYIEAFGYPA